MGIAIFNEIIYISGKKFYINYVPVMETVMSKSMPLKERGSFHITYLKNLLINQDPDFQFAIYRVDGTEYYTRKYQIIYFMLSKDKFYISLDLHKNHYRPVLYIHKKNNEFSQVFSRIDRILSCLFSSYEIKEEFTDELGLKEVKDMIKELLLKKNKEED